MPYTFNLRRTPKGREYVEAVTSGEVDLQAANDFNARFAKGGAYAGKTLLTVVSDGTAFTVEGRKAIISGNGDIPLIAIVVTSAPLRVLLGFILKAAATLGAAPASQAPIKSFSKLDEAVAWLDEELDKQAR